MINISKDLNTHLCRLVIALTILLVPQIVGAWMPMLGFFFSTFTH